MGTAGSEQIAQCEEEEVTLDCTLVHLPGMASGGDQGW
jgi:hypothetical protein